MRNSACPPFADNWSYIKTELQWLDRLLLLAVAKNRRERREFDKVSRSDGDRVTQHWWKGLITLDGPPLYDEGRPPDLNGNSRAKQNSKSAPASTGNLAGSSAGNSIGNPTDNSRGTDAPSDKRSTPKPGSSYQQQIEARIQASQARGVVLGLPELCDRLQLTLFEKKLVLLGLAPEVNRRYTRLYRYLQENEAQDLPQVDLALKLLCRNDREWNQARRRLAENSPLVQQGLLDLVTSGEQPLLTHQVKLSTELVNYLLASPIEPDALSRMLADRPRSGLAPAWVHLEHSGLVEQREPTFVASASDARSKAAEARSPGQVSPEQFSPKLVLADPWKPLILPRSLKRELQHLSQRVQLLALDPPDALAHPRGTFVLLSGPSGTGKTLAARAIAQSAQTNLMTVNLAALDTSALAQQLEQWLHQWQRQAPTVLLFRTAEKLLGPSALLSAALVEQFFLQRRQQPCLTLFSTTLQPRIAKRWQQQCDRLLDFPPPDAEARQRLWKQALTPGRMADLMLDSRVSSAKLAQQGRLTGAEIEAIARDAVLYAKTDGKTKLTHAYLQRAWRQRQGGR